MTFTPTQTGTRTGTLTITDNAAGSPQMVSLTGTGTAPAVTLSASSLSVGNQAVGTTSAMHTMTLTNSGNAALTVTSVTASGDFAETNTCGGSLAAGASCTISVTFTPTAPGTKAGTITITDNAPGSLHVVTLTGTGIGPAVSFSASTLSVGGQVVGTTSAAHKLTLTNTGNAALSITSVAVSPASLSQINTCGSSLAAGASCTVSVTFTPTTAGEITGVLGITDNAAGSPQQVVLSGVGQDFGIGTYNLAATIPAGATATYDMAVWPEGGFNQTVSLACSGAPQQSSCTVTPTSTVLDGRTHAVAALRVFTKAPAGVPPTKIRPLGPPVPWSLAWAESALLLLAILAVAAKNRSASVAKLRWSVLPAASALLLTVLWAACGAGGTIVSPVPTGGTPGGSYVITVTGTSGKLSHATTVQLTVQ